MPGPIIKGTALPVLVSDNPSYFSEIRQFIREVEYRGPEAAIRGLQQQFINDGYSYRITNDGPVFSIFVHIVEQVVDEQLDRWEVFTESTEKSLFELPDVVQDAANWDASIDEGEPTFRDECEAGVNRKDTAAFGIGATAESVIKHLRAGTTGWQLDLVGLRRTRTLRAGSVAQFQITLDTGLFVYSTAQLNLPPAVAFAVPGTPSAISDLYVWGWRKRSQRVEIVGSFVEQTVELLLAPWSTLAYAPANGALIW